MATEGFKVTPNRSPVVYTSAIKYLNTLMMFTTTISVNSIYNTSSVIIAPIIWLYITVVVISFSIYFFVVGYCWYYVY